MGTRVVVTGMGVVSPVGNDVPAFWDNVVAGRSGICTISGFDTGGLATQFGGYLGELCPRGVEPRELRRMDRFTAYGLEAAAQAWDQAGIAMDHEDPYRVGVLMGTGIGGAETFYDGCVTLETKGPRRMSPLFVPMMLPNMAGGVIAMRLGLMGPNKAVVSACATGAHAIADAAMLIQCGQADAMIAGGAEAAVFRLGLAGFGAMRALSRRNDAPEKASRPFDKDRDGFVLSDGAGALVLESEAHARARGATILGELAGAGESCDAFHITSPREDGSGAAAAMRTALANARAAPDDVDYYNAHGTSTLPNDPMEARALERVFGGSMPPVSSTKSVMGHLLGAAGAVEAVVCLAAIENGIIPPNINYETPDPACGIPVVGNEAREADVAIAMSNSLGFGGHNASLVFRKYQ